MSVLLAAPYNLVFDDLIIVVGTAQNSYGFATLPSQANSAGAHVRVIPSQMTSPTVVLKSDTTITIMWTALTGT